MMMMMMMMMMKTEDALHEAHCRIPVDDGSSSVSDDGDRSPSVVFHRSTSRYVRHTRLVKAVYNSSNHSRSLLRKGYQCCQVTK